MCNWVFLDFRLYFAENIFDAPPCLSFLRRKRFTLSISLWYVLYVSLLYVVFVLMSLLFLLLAAPGALGALMEAQTESE